MSSEDIEDTVEDERGKKACSGLRQELLDCMMKSQCMSELGMSMKECMQKDAPGVDTECKHIQFSFFDCRRSLLDMRNRFRGRKGY